MMSRFVSMLMLAGLLAASGCEQKPADRTPSKVTSGEVRHDSGHATETAGDYSRQTKEEFQKNLDIRLKEMDAEIAKLREKGRDLKDKAKWDQKMTELEAKAVAARAKLPRSVTPARRLGRTPRREPSLPGMSWIKFSATRRENSDRSSSEKCSTEMNRFFARNVP